MLLVRDRLVSLMCIIYLLSLSLPSDCQQPANSINVITEGGAIGDGLTDDTDAIISTVELAYSQTQDVYFPPGSYLISGPVKAKDGVSLYGDATGVSVIMSIGTPQIIGENVWNIQMGNINIEDLHFLNITLGFGRGNNVSNYAIRRCIFMANDSSFNTEPQINWSYIREGIIEHCIFLRQSNCQEGPGLKFFKTNSCIVRENVWGLDLNQTDWLATEWRGYDSWHNLLDKIQTLRQSFDLNWDQGRFLSAYYPNRVINEKIYDNIFNGSPFYGRTNDYHQDHVIYTKDFTNIEIVGNWMRGWPADPAGGLKMRNANGPGIVAANHFVNTPVLQYTYETNANPMAYKDVLLYRNWFDINENLTFNRLGLSYWENTGVGDDINIEYDRNIYNCDSGIGDIHLGTGSNLNEHKVYPTNFYSDSTTLIPIYGGASYASGSPDSARIAPFVDYPIPFYDIPMYSPVSDINESVNHPQPTDFIISQNYPNPFNPVTTINYQIAKTADVSLVIHNLIGQKIRTLINRRQSAGRYTVQWTGIDDSGNRVASGLYFYSIKTGSKIVRKKMVLLK